MDDEEEESSLLPQRYDGESDQEYTDRINKELGERNRLTYGFRDPWLRSWLKDEAFWKEVTVNVVSGLIVAFLVVFLAVFVGILRPWMIAAVLTVLILLLGLVATGFRISAARGHRWNGKLNVRKFLLYELEVLGVVAGLLLIVWGGAWLLGLIWH